MGSTPLTLATLLRVRDLNANIFLLFPRRLETAVLAAIWVSSPGAFRHRLAAIHSPHVNRLGILLCLRVDTDIDGRVQTILNSIADEANLHDWVVAALLAHVEQRVLGVEGLGLLVGVVGRGLLNLAEEVLLDVELANVRDCSTLDRVVGKKFSAVVNDSYGC
jgi:hypothetical protein